MTPDSDPFASVRLKRNTPIQEPMMESENKSNSDIFNDVRVKKAEGFSNLYETGRHATRIGSRIAETIGGIPGDVGSLIQSGIFSGLEKLVGHKISPEARKESKDYRPPTSHELQELSEEATGGFTKAQSDIEKTGDEIAKTAASLLGPMKFRKVLGLAVGSQAAKEGIKILGAGEGSQEAGKLGTMLLLSMFNPKGALNYSSKQYDLANNVAKGASITAKNFENKLRNTISNLEKGVSTSEKNSVLKPAEELLKKIKNGKIPVQELTSAKRDINKLMGEPETLKGAKKLLKSLGKDVDDAIKPYEKINPEFSKLYRPANEIYGAVMQGSKASNFIKKSLGAKSFLGTVIAEAALGHPEYVLPTIGVAGVSIASAKTIDFLTRISKSPELQKYYGRALLAAVKEDVPTLRLYADKIEKNIANDQSSSQSFSKK